MTIEYKCRHIADLQTWREKIVVNDDVCPSCHSDRMLGLLLDARGWLDHGVSEEENNL
jgi:uncharacterized protein YrrD